MSFISVFIIACAGFAAHAATQVDSVMSIYRQAPAVQARVKKTITQDVMETKNESEGRFYFSKGKIRLDFDKPERSTLVFDGRSVWLESRLDDKHVQVSRVKSGALRKSNSLLAALFDRRDALSQFKLIERTEKKGVTTFAYAPKDTKSTEVRRLEISIGEKEIHGIAYKDELGNHVDFEFRDVKTGPVPPATFKYQPPRGASVTNL